MWEKLRKVLKEFGEKLRLESLEKKVKNMLFNFEV